MRPTALLLTLFVASACIAPAPGSNSGDDKGSTSSTGAEAATTTVTEPVLPEGTEDLPPALQEELIYLIGRTQELRELPFLEPPKVDVVTPDELAADIMQQFAEELDTVEVDEALYRLLGMLDDDDDLLTLYQTLYGESVIGYYDGEIQKLVVTSSSETFSPLEESTIVHELTHAVTDQHFHLHDAMTALDDEQRWDEYSGMQALVEGDAVLSELHYVQQLTPSDQADYLTEAMNVDTSVLDSAPEFIAESLVFPYDTGLEFVMSLHGQGGYQALDDAYSRPPESTEQVFDPSGYLIEHPLQVEMPTSELAGYELTYQSNWGELGFQLMFDQLVGGNAIAADGWGGDSYAVYYKPDGGDLLMTLEYQGDTVTDTEEMEEALRQSIEAGMDVSPHEELEEGEIDREPYVGGDYAFVSRSEDRLLWIVATDPAVGAAARGWFSDF
ncbi:MAG TPA: hypothetical protein VID03_11740 [Acidimicrobiia bacterium]